MLNSCKMVMIAYRAIIRLNLLFDNLQYINIFIHLVLHSRVGISEHIGISPLIKKQVKP